MKNRFGVVTPAPKNYVPEKTRKVSVPQSTGASLKTELMRALGGTRYGKKAGRV